MTTLTCPKGHTFESKEQEMYVVDHRFQSQVTRYLVTDYVLCPKCNVAYLNYRGKLVVHMPRGLKDWEQVISNGDQ